MSHILSPIEDINRITIEPFPTNRQVRGARVVRIDRVVVAVDEKGQIYSTQVLSCCAYVFGANMEATLKGVQRLGLLSAKAAKQHNDMVALMAAKDERRWAANTIANVAKTLGLKLTNAQLGAIERAREEK